MKFDATIGPASILTVLGALGQAAVVVWMISAFQTKTIDKFDAVDTHFTTLTDQVSKVATSSNKRFETVHTELASAKNAQSDENSRIGKVETAISYISNQIMRVEAKLDGGPPTPALPTPTKP